MKVEIALVAIAQVADYSVFKQLLIHELNRLLMAKNLVRSGLIAYNT